MKYTKLMISKKAELLFNQMKVGQVYRRSALAGRTNAIDRHLAQLVKATKIHKMSPGLYLRPYVSDFGRVPPDSEELIECFLKDDRFLLNSYNNYNMLGLGLSQLYNHSIVYNYKRHGEFTLANRLFQFKRVPKFPSKLTKEYLLVDLLNNLKDVAEDECMVLENIKLNLSKFDRQKVLVMVRAYGRPRAKKFLKQVYGIK